MAKQCSDCGAKLGIMKPDQVQFLPKGLRKEGYSLCDACAKKKTVECPSCGCEFPLKGNFKVFAGGFCCPHCKTAPVANVKPTDNIEKVSEVSQEPAAPKITASVETGGKKKQKVSKLAVAAFVCGLASVVLVFFSAIAAFVLGIMALRKPNASGKDKAYAITGMVLGVCLTTLMLIAFSKREPDIKALFPVVSAIEKTRKEKEQGIVDFVRDVFRSEYASADKKEWLRGTTHSFKARVTSRGYVLSILVHLKDNDVTVSGPKAMRELATLPLVRRLEARLGKPDLRGTKFGPRAIFRW